MTTQNFLLLFTHFILVFFFCKCHSSRSANPEAIVQLVESDAGYQLYRNGEPFLVAGAAGGDQLNALAQAGGNTIRVYHPDSLSRLLDEAERLGLAVIADLPIPAFYAADDTTYQGERFETLKGQINDYVVKHKDHPALLFWVLGNEIQLHAADGAFRKAFNELVDEIHELDPNHPVSTAVVAHDLISIYASFKKINADFVCINVFGNIADFTFKKEIFSLIWQGPYLISEWGINGYWEAEMTRWNAPIEPPSTTKAPQLRQRYYDRILSLQDDRCLGSLVFFWGHKYERTPTWFNFFDEVGNKSQSVVEMSRIWDGKDTVYTGPSLEYLLVDDQGAYDNILLTAGQSTTVSASYETTNTESYTFSWQVQQENWHEEQVAPTLPNLPVHVDEASSQSFVFDAPDTPGPYRIYLKVVDSSGYYATANVPVYILEEATNE